MAVAPTTSEIQAHVETDLATAALQRLIDDAEEEVISRYGAHNAQVETLVGGDVFLFPSRLVEAVTSITETVGTSDTTLAANDYASKNSGRMLKRLTTGTNGRSVWAPEVTLSYTPVNDDDRRKRVMIDLVRLAIQYKAAKGEEAGDYSSTEVEYQNERESILNTLNTRRRNYA